MKPSTRRFLYWLANGGLILAAFLAALPFGMSVYGRWTQSVQRQQFLEEELSTPPSPPVEETTPFPQQDQAKTNSPKKGVKNIPKVKTLPRRKWESSRIEIPAIGVDAIVREKKGSWRWVTGPAHQPGTAGPGGAGNCVIAAHRNMWDATFSDLPRLQPGNRVYVTTRSGKYIYRIRESREVTTSDLTPLRDTKDGRITLYTCVLPFDPHRRWVVQGRLEGEKIKLARKPSTSNAE